MHKLRVQPSFDLVIIRHPQDVDLIQVIELFDGVCLGLENLPHKFEVSQNLLLAQLGDQARSDQGLWINPIPVEASQKCKERIADFSSD